MGDTINILALTHNYPRTPQDHSGRFILNIYKHFPQNFRVKVIAPQTVFDVPVARTDNYEGVEILRIKYWFKGGQNLFYGGVIDKVKNPINIIKLFAYFISLTFACLNEIKISASEGRRFNLIHAHWWIPNGFIAWIVSNLTDIPYVITSHGTDIFILRKGRNKFMKPFARLVLKKSSMLTTVSSSIADVVTKVFGEDFVRQNLHVEVLPMPYEYDMFDHALSPDRENMILSIGRFTERKGYKYLIEGYAQFLKNCKEHNIEPPVLKLYGFGPDLESLKELAKSLGVDKTVVFGGEIKDHQDVPPIIKKAKAFVIPSITDRNQEAEGLGIVILEAMASGVPLLATSSGGITDLVKNKINGYLVPEKDSKAIADTLLYMFEHPEETEAYARKGLEDIIRYSDKNISERFQKYFVGIAA
jgi:glycosyltransferase involved in cell wall biosynthesis